MGEEGGGTVRRAERVAAVKAALAQSIEAAKKRGAVIVCDIDRVERDDGAFGCCALASLDVAKVRGPRVPFVKNADEMAREWDSVEAGFDGIDPKIACCQDNTRVLADFWRVGLELRQMFRPVTADAFLRGAP